MTAAARGVVVAWALSACGKPSTTADAGLQKLPPLASAPLGTERVWALDHPLVVERDRPPSNPAQLAYLFDAGYGGVSAAPGLTPAVFTVDGGAPAGAGDTPVLLARFVHLADMQLADDESPSRLVGFDNLGDLSGAFRPQEAWGCQMLNAAARSINALHRSRPIEFVVMGGDNADNAQRNEVQWFDAVLDGAPQVECDSGDDDDVRPGPGNDPKDAFAPEGLAMPWKWVTGNHDVLNQGVFQLTADARASYVGAQAQFGTRRWAQGEAAPFSGAITADPRREALVRSALMAEVAGSGDGHGLKAPGATQDGKAFYPVETALGRVRLVVLDTSIAEGSAEGILLSADVESRVRPMLEKAERDGVYVILVSHHSPQALTDGSNFGGQAQPGALTTTQWRDFLGQFPHVVMHLAGHSHEHHTRVARPATGHAFFESESASIADWPQQPRLIEVYEEGAFLHLKLTPFDYAEDDDALAAEARRRAAVDSSTGWAGGNLRESGAVELWFPKVR